jgi:hypothetical protein
MTKARDLGDNAQNTKPKVVDAKGDLIVGTGADAAGRLAVASTAGYLLSVDSGETTGLKWSAPAGGGANWSLLNSGGTALTGAATITVSGISAKDKIMVQVRGASSVNTETSIGIRINTDTGTNYKQSGSQVVNGAAGAYDNDLSYIINADMSTNAGSLVHSFTLITGGNSSGVKVFSTSGSATAAGGSGQVLRIGGGIWDNSATITSISVVSLSGNLDAGNVFIYTSD